MDNMELPGIRLNWERPVIGTVLHEVRTRSVNTVKKYRMNMIDNPPELMYLPGINLFNQSR